MLYIMGRIKKLEENSKGRNTKFEITRAELVRQIEKGIHPNMHIRVINGVKTPCTNPNNIKKGNLD